MALYDLSFAKPGKIRDFILWTYIKPVSRPAFEVPRVVQNRDLLPLISNGCPFLLGVTLRSTPGTVFGLGTGLLRACSLN